MRVMLNALNSLAVEPHPVERIADFGDVTVLGQLKPVTDVPNRFDKRRVFGFGLDLVPERVDAACCFGNCV